MSDEKRYELKLDESYFAVFANDLVNGNQEMTLRELKLFCIVVSQIVKEDKDFKTYETTATQLGHFLGLKNANSLFKDFDAICSRLTTRTIGIKKPASEKFTYITLFSLADYDKGKVTFKLNSELKPYLLQLEAHYTQAFIETVLGFNNYYGLRLYLYLLAKRGANPYLDDNYSFSIAEIKELFGAENKDSYEKNNRNLLDKTLIPALEDINNCDCASVYNYEEIKSAGRGKGKITGVKFTVKLMNPAKRSSWNWIKKHNGASEKEVWLKKGLPIHRRYYDVVLFDEYLDNKLKAKDGKNASIIDVEGDNDE